MKKQTLLLLTVLSTSSTFAQEVISTQGDVYSNASGNISFTIGEVVIDTGTDGTNTITQGFHQTNWNFLGLDNHNLDFSATVYPNPIVDELNIQTSTFEEVNYSLFDATGKIIAEDQLSGTVTSLNVTDLPTGFYSILLTDKNKNPLKTFKLVKNF